MRGQLSSADKALVEEARRIIRERVKEGKHHIGCALRTRSGGLFAAVHLEAYVPRISVCAEAIAIGMAAAAGDTAIDTIVAVNRRGEIISPCGMCRELIADYSPRARVIVPRGRGEGVSSIAVLLPNKYRRRPAPHRSGAPSSGATGASTSCARQSRRAR